MFDKNSKFLIFFLQPPSTFIGNWSGSNTRRGGIIALLSLVDIKNTFFVLIIWHYVIWHLYSMVRKGMVVLRGQANLLLMNS